MAKESAKTRGTYDRPVNQRVTDNSDDPAVKDGLRVINSNFTEKNKRDTKNQKIVEMFENGFALKEPLGPKKISSKKFMQALWSMITIMKIPGFTFHGSQAAPWKEKLVGLGMGSVLKKGKFDASFRNKGGLAPSLVSFGDGFRMIGSRRESGFPIEFIPIANSNLYVDTRATSMRDGTKPVTKACAVFSGTWNQFCSYFPAFADKAGPGLLPRETSYYKETDQTYLQKIKEDNITEWGYFYDIENRVYCMMVGSKCTVFNKKVGKNYKYVYKDEEKREVPYIPISQYSCIPSMEGFYNHGILELMYDLILLYTGIFNQMSQSIEDNVSPLEFVNLPPGEEKKFFEKIEMAYKERSLGRRAMIPVTQTPTAPNGVSLQPFATQTLINEAVALFDRIDLEIKRMGIHLDAPEQTGNPTATEILDNIERATKFTRQIMEFNASQVEFELDVAMDMTKKFVRSNDKTPLNITTSINIDGQMVRPDFATLGILKKSLTERHWFHKVNSMTGIIPSQTMRRAQLSSVLPLHAAGTPTSKSIIRELTEMSDVDYADDAQPNPMPEQGQGGQGGAVSPQAAETVAQPPEEVARDEIRFRELSPV